MNLNPREKQRQEILQRITRSITEFETELIDNRHSREQVNLMFLEVYTERMQSQQGIIFAGPEKRINEFLQTQIHHPLVEFVNGNVVELRALEGRVLKHFAHVIEQIRNAELLREDSSRQEIAAAAN